MGDSATPTQTVPASPRKRNVLGLAFGLCLWVGAIASTVYPAFPALNASYQALKIEILWSDAASADEALELQRRLQAHYLSYGVYVPLDDIVIAARDSRTQPLPPNMAGICGPGTTSLWVPLTFHFPIVGVKVFEWCLVRTS